MNPVRCALEGTGRVQAPWETWSWEGAERWWCESEACGAVSAGPLRAPCPGWSSRGLGAGCQWGHCPRDKVTPLSTFFYRLVEVRLRQNT